MRAFIAWVHFYLAALAFMLVVPALWFVQYYTGSNDPSVVAPTFFSFAAFFAANLVLCVMWNDAQKDYLKTIPKKYL